MMTIRTLCDGKLVRGVSILQMAIDDYKLSKTMEKMELDRKELEEM